MPAVAQFMVVLDATVVNVALPVLGVTAAVAHAFAPLLLREPPLALLVLHPCFAALYAANSLAWIAANRAAATAAAGLLSTVVRFVDEHATALTLGFVVATALMVIRARPAGDRTAFHAQPA